MRVSKESECAIIRQRPGLRRKTVPESEIISKDFIREAVEEDLRTGRYDHVHTRFPPEPNGYLHIGHAKAISITYGIAEDYGGLYNLRFDDTNPVKEETEYVEGIMEDIRWLGFDWEDRLFYTSDYFEQLYEYAVLLIKKGLAYVDDLSADEIREYRGTLTEPGRNSSYRDRSAEENLDLFARMRAGEFPDGARVLRAKIDMASPNINLRDPVMYRILHAEHHRTGDAWCIYPMYDYSHPISDAIEGITHSLCSLEYEDHRPLYNWVLEKLGVWKNPPRQIEFARYSLTHTVVSKRKLLRLVKEGHVRGWDDPRMPTLSAMRRRGYTTEAIRIFCDSVGVAKTNTVIDIAFLEHCVRDDLNQRCNRVMGVLRPLKLVIDNYPEGQVEEMEAVNHPLDPDRSTRKVPFSRELYIERDDFMEQPVKKFYRLAPGREVRLRYAYLVTCTDVVKNEAGEVIEVHCTYDPATRGGDAPDGRKVRGTLHWVSAAHAVDAEVRLYDRLFTNESPEEDVEDFVANVNPNSLEVLTGCKVEPSLAGATVGSRTQFERKGYFCVDPDSASLGSEGLVFNETVSLRDSWAKIQAKQK
ncbi:MAG: glutamine--tRNA ligase/YqeY domain fusion protein [Anaerolineae bacterium]|nr:glutamine--tRNA ligase/YqeY domain fusion protein [Anaerolineae bacterium]